MERRTDYVRGYGYVTQQQQGEGVFDSILKTVTGIITSDNTKQVITEGAKAA